MTANPTTSTATLVPLIRHEHDQVHRAIAAGLEHARQKPAACSPPRVGRRHTGVGVSS